jgi:hypothetical protein
VRASTARAAKVERTRSREGDVKMREVPAIDVPARGKQS